MASLSLKNIYKKYDNGFCAVTDFNLEVADKEFVVFVGPSGCGKSTTLRMIAGLEDITEGEFYIGDRLVNDVEPKDRDIAMVFQSYALYPHMTVFDNMAFALKLRKVPKDEIKAKVEEAAKNLKVSSHSLWKLGLIDGIIDESLGGAHRDPECTALNLKRVVLETLEELKSMSTEELLEKRYSKFRGMGVFYK